MCGLISEFWQYVSYCSVKWPESLYRHYSWNVPLLKLFIKVYHYSNCHSIMMFDFIIEYYRVIFIIELSSTLTNLSIIRSLVHVQLFFVRLAGEEILTLNFCPYISPHQSLKVIESVIQHKLNYYFCFLSIIYVVQCIRSDMQWRVIAEDRSIWLKSGRAIHPLTQHN